MSSLVISGLRVAVDGTEILRGVELEVSSGEVHAVMGPNGSGKSTLANVIMGHPGFEVLDGSVTLDGEELLEREPWERARLGVFLAPQDPVEVPGVPVEAALREAMAATREDLEESIARETRRLGLARAILDRGLNVDCSGGEKKRLETLQLAVLHPRFAVLDELDSGLDIDALRTVARRVESETARSESPLGVIAITHYGRLLDELHPDQVHVLAGGRIVASGGRELASELERSGYQSFLPTT